MTTTTSILQPLVGRRVIVRTRISGVSLGTLEKISDDSTVVHLTDAWRIWEWTEAFTLSEVARGTGQLRVDRHPDTGVVMTDTAGVEILEVAEDAEAALAGSWVKGSR